jgi:hypothetical protein
VFELLPYLAIIAYFIYCFLKKPPAPKQGKLTTSSSRTYGYLLGDRMARFLEGGGHYNGIDVILPKEMPHIYLDSLKGGGRGESFIFDASQKIALEGNFYRSYQVFVPKKYESIALSILSPDVMQTLQQYAKLFDVEIYGNHLRIMSRDPITKHPEVQGQILVAATMLMNEIDHRLQSWDKKDSQAAIDQDLLIYPYKSVRILGRYFPYHMLWMFFYWVLVLFGLFTIGQYVQIVNPKGHWGWIFMNTAFVALIFFCFITYRGIRHDQIYTRRGRQ